ncbi:MAG TPA: hypothetical protein PLN21_20415, partial [Gemmatales bacterium]|nr:hypothetical protein [Gemmatales bacterium]
GGSMKTRKRLTNNTAAPSRCGCEALSLISAVGSKRLIATPRREYTPECGTVYHSYFFAC